MRRAKQPLQTSELLLTLSFIHNHWHPFPSHLALSFSPFFRQISSTQDDISLFLVLSTTTQTKDKVKSRLFLDVVVRERAAVLELFGPKDQTLLIWGITLLVLDLGFDIIDSIR